MSSQRLDRRVAATMRVGLRGLWERRIPFAESKRLQRIQHARLRRMVAHAYRFVPFYRRAMDEAGIRLDEIRTVEDLARLPLIDGTDLQRHPTELLSEKTPSDRRVLLFSTGTAQYGTKSVSWDHGALLAQVAQGERDRSVLRGLIGMSRPLVRLSFFHPDSSTAAVTRFQTERLLSARTRWTTHWGTIDQPYDEIAKQLDQLRPDVVFSYGSFAEAFLLHVHDQAWAVSLPRVWVFGGDGITHRARVTIEERLGCRLYSTYQAVEGGRIGFECEEGNGYHINTDLCSIRLIDERGETVRPGAMGEVVISNLYNRGTLLLNYRLGDYAVWDDRPCPCGRALPVLHLQGGRASEILRLRDGRTVQKHVFLHECKEKMHDVLQFRIVELAPEKIAWKVVAAQRADRESLARDLIACSCRALSEDADVCVEFVDRLTTNRGKLTHIVQADERSEGG